MYCVRGMDDRFKGYHLCETHLMQPSILPEDYFAYVFTNALDRPLCSKSQSAERVFLCPCAATCVYPERPPSLSVLV
jgi:hypothetical protein